MKKHLCRTLSLVLVIIMLSQGTVWAADLNGEDELARAAQIGLDISRAGEEAISGRDYAAMLDHFVAIADPSKSAAWEGMFPNFRALTEPGGGLYGPVAGGGGGGRGLPGPSADGRTLRAER